MRYTGPKARLCRRERVNLFGSTKYDKILAKRDSVPGNAGTGRPRKASEYGLQVREKQKAKRMFGVSEKQFRRYFSAAQSHHGNTGENFLQLLELRLDNVLFRAGAAATRMQARQFCTHRHVFVNGTRVKTPSLRLRAGDVVTLHERLDGTPALLEWPDHSRHLPKWLEATPAKRHINVLRAPEPDEVEQSIAKTVIVELYSR